MNKELTWKERVKLAPEFLKLGQVEQYLSRDDNDYPWDFAKSCEEGNTHRLEIYTGVWFRADHPSGLKFRWSFDIEKRGSNGSGHYNIDVDGCQSVLAALSGTAKAQFAAHLREASKAVRAKGKEWEAITKAQFKTADDLERAART
jgi:hypothetical protein